MTTIEQLNSPGYREQITYLFPDSIPFKFNKRRTSFSISPRCIPWKSTRVKAEPLKSHYYSILF